MESSSTSGARTICHGCLERYREQASVKWHCSNCISERAFRRSKLATRRFLRQQAQRIIEGYDQLTHLNKANHGADDSTDTNLAIQLIASAEATFRIKLEALQESRSEAAHLKEQFAAAIAASMPPAKEHLVAQVQQRLAHVKLLKQRQHEVAQRLATRVQADAICRRRYKQLQLRVANLKAFQDLLPNQPRQTSLTTAVERPPQQTFNAPRNDDDGDFVMTKSHEAVVYYNTVHLASLDSTSSSLSPSTATNNIRNLQALLVRAKRARVKQVLSMFKVTDSTINSMSLPRDGNLSPRLRADIASIWQALTVLSQLCYALSHALCIPVSATELWPDDGLHMPHSDIELSVAHERHAPVWHFRLLRHLARLFVEDGATLPVMLRGQPLHDGAETTIASPLILIRSCCDERVNERLGLHHKHFDQDIARLLPSADDFVLV
eukprot:TRINITY_DN12104_c0_g1_i10.p1 TRINITY_DN12104_c0_g1~~TRINITY_DN12104_c0_g1_i10.p1  ORF type:complete len:438 (+),score=61.50 TRINITY_DN12104_c0_g1_i10:1218-2531(+)